MKMPLRERQEIFAKNVGLLIGFIFAQGYTCTLGEAYRTKEQAEWYAKEGKGVNNSKHCRRLAIDLNLFQHGCYLTSSTDYEFAGQYWYTLHPDNTWGGAGNDGNHFSMGGGLGW
jgi:hypothetical protein